MKDFPDLKIVIETSAENVLKLAQNLRPEWDKSKIQVVPLSGGRSNLMSRCFVDPESDDQIVVRASQVLADISITHFQFEKKVVLKMSELGHFGKVLATFANGYCYQLVKGKPLFSPSVPSLIINDLQLKCVAERLADINCVKLEDENYTETDFFQKLHRMLDTDYPDSNKLTALLPPREKLKGELTFWEDKFKQMSSCDDLPLVLCHGDSHPGNIIWNEIEKLITFVDWEISHIGYQVFDVAYFLHLLFYDDIMFKSFEKSYPDDTQNVFIRYYLEKYFQNTGRNKNDLTHETAQKFAEQVNVFKMIVAIYLPIVMASMAKNQTGTEGFPKELGDPESFLVRMFDDYFEKKNKC